MEVQHLKPEHYEEFMTFSNMIFSQTYGPFFFQEDIPIAFGPSPERMNYQYAIIDDDRIHAALGAIPYTFQVDGETFKVRHITNVETHYNYTGKGYMQAIFRTALDEMSKEDVDFTLLCGHRERYRFFGFETAGEDIIATFQYYNAENRRKYGEKDTFSFKEVCKEDSDGLKQILDFYNTSSMGYIRPSEVAMDHMTIYQTKPYLIYSEGGIVTGYLLSQKKRGIVEMFLRNPKDLPMVIYSFMEFKKMDKISLWLSPLDFGLRESAYDAAEEIRIDQLSLLKILKPLRLLTSLLNYKQNHGGSLPKGQLILDTIWGKLLIVNDGTFSVSFTDLPADAVLDGKQIYALLFGPTASGISRFSQIPDEFKSWFPLPFYIYRVDHY